MRTLFKLLCLALCLTMLPAFALSGGAEETEPITIVITDWNTGAPSEYQKAACEQYMAENPGILIDHQTIPYDEYHTKLNTLIAAGECPDIYYISDMQAIEWGENGVAADLEALYAAEGIDMREKFLGAALYGTEDKIYGLAYGIVNMVMYYNKDIYDANGVAYPSLDASNPIAWEDWVETLSIMTVDLNGKHPGEDGFNPMGVKTYGTLLPSWVYKISALLYSNEGAFFDDEKFILDEEAGKEVIQKIYDLISVYQVAPTPIAQKALPAIAQMFVDGQLATVFDGSYMYPTYAADMPNIGVAPLPMLKQPATIGWAACSQMSSTTKHPEEVFKFFRWYHEADTNPLHLKSNLPNEFKYYEDESLFDLWMDPAVYNEDFRTTVPGLMAAYAFLPEMDTVKNASQIFEEYLAPTLDLLWLEEKNVDEVLEIMSTDMAGLYKGKW